MPIAEIKFQLPEEQEEHYDAINGSRYRAALQDFDNWLRSMIKYEDKFEIKTQEVRDRLREEVKGHGVELW